MLWLALFISIPVLAIFMAIATRRRLWDRIRGR